MVVIFMLSLIMLTQLVAAAVVVVHFRELAEQVEQALMGQIMVVKAVLVAVEVAGAFLHSAVVHLMMEVQVVVLEVLVQEEQVLTLFT
jgi:hypothetical protein